ncbi:hypothetical protein [Pararhizobium qamdonense]|uniref:hypothetical protein n=1 Tax=Pararhizobium qamdonense TaxID=3031126 RepID=UPI0023E1045B|nr:hypothetical protein [Pararhizobium qamdonense]
MLNEVQEWKRSDAEKQFTDLLEGAKEGRIQRIADVDGTFEVKFTAKSDRERIGDVLARGGPSDT